MPGPAVTAKVGDKLLDIESRVERGSELDAPE